MLHIGQPDQPALRVVGNRFQMSPSPSEAQVRCKEPVGYIRCAFKRESRIPDLCRKRTEVGVLISRYRRLGAHSTCYYLCIRLLQDKPKPTHAIFRVTILALMQKTPLPPNEHPGYQRLSALIVGALTAQRSAARLEPSPIPGFDTRPIPDQIVHILTAVGPLAPQEIATRIRVSRATALRAMRQLLAEGRVVARGSTRNRSYRCSGASELMDQPSTFEGSR